MQYVDGIIMDHDLVLRKTEQETFISAQTPILTKIVLQTSDINTNAQTIREDQTKQNQF